MSDMTLNFRSGHRVERPRHIARASGSYQRRLHALACAGLAGLMLSLLAATPGGAEESKYQRARREHPDLFKLYYDETVMAYCGLLTPESEAGFRLERDTLLAA